jgi:hypothetical protein
MIVNPVKGNPGRVDIPRIRKSSWTTLVDAGLAATKEINGLRVVLLAHHLAVKTAT